MRCAIRVRRIFGARLINFPQSWGEQRTPGTSSSLCVHAKKRTNIGLWRMVCEPFANGAAQVHSPVHTYAHLVHELLVANRLSQTVRERFANHSACSCIRGFRIVYRLLRIGWRYHLETCTTKSFHYHHSFKTEYDLIRILKRAQRRNETVF